MSDYDSKPSFGELVSDPCVDWEEDADLEFDIDLDCMPNYSQKSAMSLLHEEQGQELGSKFCTNQTANRQQMRNMMTFRGHICVVR